MESYRSYCPHCNSEYTWTGFKTGIGKSQEQLDQMKKDHNVCRKCNKEGLKTELDFGSSIAHKFQNSNIDWKEKIKHLQGGAFLDELRYAQNQLLELPIEETPSEEEILQFITECLKKDFKEVFFQWNEANKK
jgi:RNA polymerase subunit RPABC4/transcription elongation factor Spt4